MARPAVKTQTLLRAQLADALNNDPRAIRAFENMASDVSQTLPDATESASQAAQAAQDAAYAARVIAEDAYAEVEQSQLDSQTSLSVAFSAEAAAKQALDEAEFVQALIGQVIELRDMIAALSRRVEDLENRP